jgi:drug/metabolite transporter (DMT)-like permease
MNKRALIYVNIAVLLFGFAGLFGKWIELPSVGVTFGRVFFSSIALGLFMLITRQSFRLDNLSDVLTMIAGGFIMGIHWWSIFESIKLSSVAIGTITFSTFPLFLTFLEPLVYRQKIKRRNVIMAVIIIIGVILTIPEFSFDNDIFKGVLIGMISPAAYSVLTLINKRFSEKYNGTKISFYEQAVAAVFLLPFTIVSHIEPTAKDIGLLIIFGVVTTALAHTLFINCLKYIPAQLAAICSSMETVYGIIFAMIFLKEIPWPGEIAGAVIILGTVLYAQLTDMKTSDEELTDTQPHVQ